MYGSWGMGCIDQYRYFLFFCLLLADFLKPIPSIIFILFFRFSGVTEEDLENTRITLRDVQAVLLCMFSCDTILLGHSLESDLFALKVIYYFRHSWIK